MEQIKKDAFVLYIYPYMDNKLYKCLIENISKLDKYERIDILKNVQSFLQIIIKRYAYISYHLDIYEMVLKILNTYDNIFSFYKITHLPIECLSFIYECKLRSKKLIFLLQHGHNNIYLYKKVNNIDNYLYSKSYVLNYL